MTDTYEEPIIVEYARAFFPVILIVLLLRSFLVEPFRIPSSSMMPTLLVGDFILVNKFSYGLRWPVINQKFVEFGEPERGDIVVFRSPEDPSTDFIKRVVGVPGDRIGYDFAQDVLYVNGEAMTRTPIGAYVGRGAAENMNGATLAVEELGTVEHQILFDERRTISLGCQGPALITGTLEVPPNSYFAMGDNRDNSNDSRCWGMVPEDNLVGKAFVIWMNWDLRRPGFPIDWRRLGKLIH